MKRGTAIAAASLIESLEPRIQFTDLVSLGWAYRLPTGYGPASVTIDVGNLGDAGVSGELRLSLYLSPRALSPNSNSGGSVIAEETSLVGVEAGAHALRSASEYFDMDGVTPGTYYINAILMEHTPRGAWERVFGQTLETIRVDHQPNQSVPGQSGTSHDGKINGFDAGDTQADATAPGPLPFTSELEEIAGNDVDYYKFTIGAESSVSAVLNDPTGTLAFTLLGNDGAVLDEAPVRAVPEDGGDAAPARISETLPAGTYTLRVSTTDKTDRAEYTVSVSAVELGGGDDGDDGDGGGGGEEPPPAGNPLNTARGLGTPPNTQVNESTTAEDPDDHYSFTLPQRSSVTVEVSQLLANLDVDLLNGNGTSAATSAATGTTTELMTRVLEPGTYYLRVHGDAPSTYSLRVTSTPAPLDPSDPGTPGTPGNGNDDDDDDEAIANARDLGSLPTTAMSGDVRDGHTADAYKFTLPARSRVDTVLGDLSSPVEIALLKENGSAVTRTRKSDASERTLSRTLAAGTYFVLVFRGTGSTTGSGYTLSLATTQLEAPGSGAPSAPVGPPEVTFKGPKAAKKAYRFTVTYTDPNRINEATVGPDDVVVTGPNGFSRTASILRTKLTKNGTRLAATYVIDPPNGTWFSNENGEYQVNLQPGTVADASGNGVIGGVVGTFAVNSKKVAPTSATLFASAPIESGSDARDVEDDFLTSLL